MTYTIYSFSIVLALVSEKGRKWTLKERGIVSVYADEDAKEKIMDFYLNSLDEYTYMSVREFYCVPLVEDIEAVII